MPSMRIILCCLGLLFAAPAFANPVEDGLCHARPQSVEKMERSEKLCRALVRAMSSTKAGQPPFSKHCSSGLESLVRSLFALNDGAKT
jgi:hypothetical protein